MLWYSFYTLGESGYNKGSSHTYWRPRSIRRSKCHFKYRRKRSTNEYKRRLIKVRIYIKRITITTPIGLLYLTILYSLELLKLYLLNVLDPHNHWKVIQSQMEAILQKITMKKIHDGEYLQYKSAKNWNRRKTNRYINMKSYIREFT